MTRTGLPMLELDDPLSARRTPAEQAREADRPRPPKQDSQAKPARQSSKRAQSTSAATAPPAATDLEAGREPWRTWGTGSRTATYRLPEGLLEELDERARRLNLPLGMTVAAGVLLLLDQDDHALIGHVDRVEDARRAAKRAARARATSIEHADANRP